MKKLAISLFAGLFLLSGNVLAAEQQTQPQAQTLDQLLQQVRDARSAANAANKQREREFLAARDKQQQLLSQSKQRLAAEEARSDRLQKTFQANEQELNQLSDQLRTRLGNLGELFGVVRQVSGDLKSVTDASLVSAQIPGRGEFLSRMSQSTQLPDIESLEKLWFMMQQEATLSGKIVKFPAEVVSVDGNRYQADVVRVGVFNAIADDTFLRYLPETGALVELTRQPAGRYQDMASDLYSAGADEIVEMGIDPTRGQLLALLVDTPTFMERVNQGGLVGYVIIVLGVIGLLVAVERLVYLGIAGKKIRAQLTSSKPSGDNALGRVLSVYLGLLGTVTGMILTFQAITLFGTGDPKLMAGGISQALVTTVQGLCVAIPMVLLHGFVSSRAKGLIQILEEQSAGIIAAHAERQK